MRTLSSARTLLVAVFLFVMGCAGAAPRQSQFSAKPPPDVNLDNTRWWLKIRQGKQDERLVEFRKTGDEYVAVLKSPGKVLSTMNYKAGEPYIRVKKVGPGKYEGRYLTVFPDRTRKWRPVQLTVFKSVFRWDVMDTDSWERLP